MRFLVAFFFFFVFLVSSLVQPKSSAGDRLLVILRDAEMKVSHRSFFNSLKAKGYKITFGTTRDNNLVLHRFGEYAFDHLILFVGAGEEKFAPKISVQSVVDFIDEGHNVLLATDSQLGQAVNDLGAECGVDFSSGNTFVIDHFHHHPGDKADHTLLVANQAADIDIITDQLPPVLFRGVGHTLNNEDNGLNIPVLTGHSTSYSYYLKKQITKAAAVKTGRKLQLVSLLQARNNARVAISGSLDLFSDQFFDTVVDHEGQRVQAGNELLAKRLSEWVFQERGVLRVESIFHSHADSLVSPAFYTIKDKLHYSIKISLWDGQQWGPFQANDVQLEFVRLDPWIRTNLTPDSKGNFNTTFVIPDVNGVYSMIVEYSRPGYSSISTRDTIPVRPFRHNQYERFIEAAYPYYASSFSMLFGLYLFCTFFLFTRDQPKAKQH